MANQVVSLAVYAFQAKRAGVSLNALKAQSDYQSYLEGMVDTARCRAAWDLCHDDPLEPLGQIELSVTDFQDIVDQVYRGTDPSQVRLSAVARPVVQLVHQPYFPKYLATIAGDTRTENSVKACLDRLDDVIDNRAVATARGNGLIVGRVQSGKTRNYIGLMLKAVDDGWNVVIVLTSAIKSLAHQTRKRIVSEFAKVGADNSQFACELDFLDSGAANRKAGNELNGDYFYWGVSMKQVNGLERIRKWLNLPNQPHGSMRVLIIDDESDNATPDSNAGGTGNLDDEGIEERIQGIRRAPGYEELADWFDSLLTREWPDLNAKTPEAEAFSKIEDVLKSNVSAKRKKEQIVNSADYRRFLGMDKFVNPPVENLISRFFVQVRGGGDDSCGAFVLLLKSILDIVRGRSAINATICELIGPHEETGTYAYPFQRCAYLGYTATPYANILNEGPSHTPIYADFIQSLTIAPQYFGADAIFGHDIANVEPRMPIVGPITEDDELHILNPLRETAALDIDAELVCRDNGVSFTWQSLRDAVAWAFCTAAVRKLLRSRMTDPDKKEKIDHRWTTMLVNVDHRQVVHEIVCRALDAYVTRQCETPQARAAYVGVCKTVWDELTAKFPLGTFNDLFNRNADADRDYGTIADYPAWTDIEPQLVDILENSQRVVHTVVFNSTAEGLAEQQRYSQNEDDIQANAVMELTGDHLWIVSGGNTIGRGLTLLGLTASYFDRVRDGTCVDTLTQMGRWFGYRPGYELLPRIWMNRDAVGEMKRIAALELKLHESIADNFAQHFSPSDPAHFQQISSWGRQLSGRAFASRNLDSNVGTTASTDDFYDSDNERNHVLTICSDFIRSLGNGSVRDPKEFDYANIPLWEDVSHVVVRQLLERLLPYYPDRSRKILRGIMRDICCTKPINWDVVIGTPTRTASGQTVDFAGQRVSYGSPTVLPSGGGVVLRSSTTRLHMPFYAMIRTEYLIREDVSLVCKWKNTIADAIDARRIANGGTLPSQYETALPGNANESVLARLDRLISDLRQANGTRPLPEAVHSRLRDVSPGFANRSSAEYMANVHRSANHTRPVLQFYLIKPMGDRPSAKPLVNISIYWPDHEPSDFFTVAVDENPDFTVMVTPRIFFQTVEDILREKDFPMQRKELLRVVLERLGARCNEGFFNQHVAQPLAGYQYHKMAGRNAYCIDGWSSDEEQKLKAALLQEAVHVLQRDRRAYRTDELLEQVVLEQPKFRDFFVPSNAADKATLNALMTDGVLNENDITVVSRRPVTYCYHA